MGSASLFQPSLSSDWLTIMCLSSHSLIGHSSLSNWVVRLASCQQVLSKNNFSSTTNQLEMNTILGSCIRLREGFNLKKCLLFRSNSFWGKTNDKIGQKECKELSSTCQYRGRGERGVNSDKCVLLVLRKTHTINSI